MWSPLRRFVPGLTAAAGIAATAAFQGGARQNRPQHFVRAEEVPKKQTVRRTVDAQLKRVVQAAAETERSGEDEELLKKLEELESDFWQRGKIHRLVLTGGPCGGKSTVMSDLVQMLQEKNFLVFTMPEIATEMFKWSGGKMWDDFTDTGPRGNETWAELQVEMTRLQIHIEDSILMMARQSLTSRRNSSTPPRGAVVIFDRGVVDNVAYCSEDAWSLVLEQLGTTTARLRDRRYDQIIHLVTAANGAEEFYTLVQAEGRKASEGDSESTESARTETAEEARALDVRTQQVWEGAAHHFVVTNDNGKPFNQKREEVKSIVTRMIGEKAEGSSSSILLDCSPLPASEVRRLIEQDPKAERPIKTNVLLTYVGDNVRLQKRGMDSATFSYFYQELQDDSQVARQFEMDCWHYHSKLETFKKDKDSAPAVTVQEQILTFKYGDAYIRCHCYLSSEGKPMLAVEVDAESKIASRGLPTWLKTSGVLRGPMARLLATK